PARRGTSRAGPTTEPGTGAPGEGSPARALSRRPSPGPCRALPTASSSCPCPAWNRRERVTHPGPARLAPTRPGGGLPVDLDAGAAKPRYGLLQALNEEANAPRRFAHAAELRKRQNLDPPGELEQGPASTPESAISFISRAVRRNSAISRAVLCPGTSE